MSQELPKRYTPQRLSRFNDALLVYTVDFPIYYLECLSERHFIIAGGGGSSRTGVHNQINILEIVPTNNSCAADLVMKYHTPEEIPDAIMSGSLMKDLPIVSTSFVTNGSRPAIYNISFNARQKSFNLTDYELLEDDRKRELKSVRCTPGRILGGSTDGQLIVWDVGDRYDKKIIKQLKAHNKEVDEIDVNFVAKQIVTLSRDEARCAIWDSIDFKLIQEFKKEFICNPEPNSSKYCYRSCRYAYDRSIPDSNTDRPISKESFLLLACNPVPNKGSSKLYRWSTNNFDKPTSINVTNDGVMSMTVSLGGSYVAIGTRSGSVSIFEIRSMKQIYKIDGAHHNAVTNLDFLTPIPESLNLTNSTTCPLLSVSIDRRIVLHRPRKGTVTSSMFKMFLMVIIIYLTFLFLYKNYMS